MNNPDTNTHTIKVWDPLVRIFHWSLVLFFVIAYLSEDDFETIHVWAGYGVAALVCLRLVWCLIGTHHARFSDFVKSPHTIWRYVIAIPTGKAKRYIGHNPAGGAMVVALLLSLMGTTVFGMALLAAEEQTGPLAGTWLASFNGHTLEEIHEFFVNAALALIGLHIAGVIFTSLHHRENLPRAMVHGHKASREGDVNTSAPKSQGIER
jgi:cytochrome b